MRRLPLILFMFSGLLGAQVSRYEWCWAFFHPFAAVKIKNITKQCDKFPGKGHPLLDNFSSGGKLDAYRHVFYMAAYAQKVSSRKLLRLGQAHEKGNFRQFRKHRLEEGEQPDSIASVMDLHNNITGINIGKVFRRTGSIPLDSLRSMAIRAICAGNALIIKRDASGNYVKCDGSVIAPEELRSWRTPKCLIRSGP